MKNPFETIYESVARLVYRLKFRQKLLLIFLPIPMAAVLLIAALWYWNAMRAAEDTIRQQTHLLARNAAMLVNDNLKQYELEIQSIVQLGWIEEFFFEASKGLSKKTKYEEQFAKLLLSLNHQYFQITCFDVTGEPLLKVLQTSYLPQDKLPAHVETSLFQDQDRAGISGDNLLKTGVNISQVMSIHGFKALIMTCPVLVQTSQKPLGVMTFVLPITRLGEEAIRPYSVSLNSEMLIVNAGGQLLFHTDREMINQSIEAAMPYLEDVVPALLNQQSGSTAYRNAADESWIVSYSPVSGIDWTIAVMSPVEPFVASTRRAGLIGLGISLVILALLITLISFFSIRFVRDISEITEGARALAAGDLERSLPVRSQDEIGELAQDFNKMSRDLKQLIRQVGLHKNLSAIGQFAAGMYHDLKSPLEGIKLLAAGMKRKTPPDSPLKHYVDEISLGVENLDRLIYETLDFVKPKSMKYRDVDLNRFLHEIMDNIGLNGVALAWELSDQIQSVKLDPVQMKHAVINLVNNAIEAMPQGGRLVIQTAIEARQVSLTFSDSGPGIASENLDHIFDPFFSSKDRGHGLGLSIVHQIVTNHGGAIKVDSREGEGTKIMISFPA